MSSEATRPVAEELLLLAAAVRFLEFSPATAQGDQRGAEGHPVLHIMQQVRDE